MRKFKNFYVEGARATLKVSLSDASTLKERAQAQSPVYEFKVVDDQGTSLEDDTYLVDSPMLSGLVYAIKMMLNRGKGSQDNFERTKIPGNNSMSVNVAHPASYPSLWNEQGMQLETHVTPSRQETPDSYYGKNFTLETGEVYYTWSFLKSNHIYYLDRDELQALLERLQKFQP